MIIAIAVILFVWGLTQCQEAGADYWQDTAKPHWVTTASLLDGYYVIAAWCVTPAEGPGLCGKLFAIDHSNPFNDDNYLVSWLSDPPRTKPEDIVGLFRLDPDKNEFKKITLPCRWVVGLGI
jgi:hypothetical protein